MTENPFDNPNTTSQDVVTSLAHIASAYRRITDNTPTPLDPYNLRIEWPRNQPAYDLMRDLATIRDETDNAIRLHAKHCRRLGMTWESIGNALGVTRQGAQATYGAKR